MIYSRYNNIDISTTYAKVNYDVFDLEAHLGGIDVRPLNKSFLDSFFICIHLLKRLNLFVIIIS